MKKYKILLKRLGAIELNKEMIAIKEEDKYTVYIYGRKQYLNEEDFEVIEEIK